MPSAKHPSCLFLLSFFLILSACAPTPTAAPIPTIPSMPVTPTLVTASSVTPPPATPTTNPTAPEITDDDILTRAQKQRLADVSQTFLAVTQEQAQQVAERIGYMKYPDPSNMCGPLAIAELREAGLLSRYVDPHDFWLLRPDTNADTIVRTFPPERFEHYRFKQSTAEFDFKKFPLKAGDLLYLYSGKGGTFEHILTVTRVDEQGRAYTVTNLNVQPFPNYYYVIKEVMLYDPNQLGVGQFYDWTDETKNNWIGLTGYGGFDVWRFAAPVQDATSAETDLADQMDSIFEQSGGEWHAVILDLDAGRVIYSRLSADEVHVASVIKIPIAMLLFASLEKQGVPPADLKSYLEGHGNGYLLSELLHDMLVKSDEKATTELLDYIRRSGLDINATLTVWGAPHVNIFNRNAPLDEIAHLMAGLYQGEFIPSQARQIILDWMAEYTPSDDERLGVLRPLLPADAEYYNKRGTITDGRLIIGDAAILAWDSKAYVIVIFGYPGAGTTNDVKLVGGIEQAARAFWEFAK
jgi:hypothetical protein